VSEKPESFFAWADRVTDAEALESAVRHFADIWRETLTELPDAYMCTYTCTEANAAADLYRALGDEDTAAAIIAAHAAYDEEGDQHYDGGNARDAAARDDRAAMVRDANGDPF
jgi:hypothetical protein